jgi:anaerobic magnesium-protoporphyrin IX monomethyl ester cyclase
MSDVQRVLLFKPYHNVPTQYYAPPLGAMYLASYLRRRGDVDVRIIHPPAVNMTYDEAGRQIRDFKPDWVGISALSFESKGLFRLAAAAKEVRKDLPVVAGGPHASFYTREVMADPNIDYVVLGEGELAADELSAALRKGGPVGQIDGLAWREGGELRLSPQKRFVEDLDALPFPAWDLVDLSAYRYYERMSRIGRGSYMGIFTSRACPYHCIYCHRMFGKGFRKRSPANVMAEIRALHDAHGVREIEIIDDCFNLDLARSKAIFDLIIESGLKLRLMFPNGLRGDNLDEEFMIKGRRAGVTSMHIAVETASPRLQKMTRKNLDLEKTRRSIELARKHGIITLGFFMLGFPTETKEELEMTVDYAVRSKLHAVNFFAVQPFEGTDLADMARQQGKPVFSDFEQMYMSGGFINLTDLPDGELKRIRQMGVLRFYASPSRIWSIVRDYPHKSQLPHLLFVLAKRLMLKR